MIPSILSPSNTSFVPTLPREAAQQTYQLRPLTGGYSLAFPNERKPQKPMSENTILYALYRLGYHSPTTGHGFRSSASTLLNELGYDSDVIERQLAHKEQNKVRAAYHRAEYLSERQTIMQDWADYIDKLAMEYNQSTQSL